MDYDDDDDEYATIDKEDEGDYMEEPEKKEKEKVYCFFFVLCLLCLFGQCAFIIETESSKRSKCRFSKKTKKIEKRKRF
jgi:hypothetical protein